MGKIFAGAICLGTGMFVGFIFGAVVVVLDEELENAKPPAKVGGAAKKTAGAAKKAASRTAGASKRVATHRPANGNSAS